MPLRKRKALPGQTKLEDVTEQDVTVTKSTAGDLAHPTKETKHDLRSAKAEDSEQHDGEDLFLKRRAKKTGMAEPAAKKQHKAGPKKEADKGASATSDAGIWVNRAPTITLWVAVVAQRQGYSREAGLSFGKAIAGIYAQAKGRRVGIYEEREKDEAKKQEKEEKEEAMGVERVDVFGMKIKVLKEGKGDDVRALDGDHPVDASSVHSYLKRAFGPRLGDAEKALKDLAESYADADELAHEAYNLYSKFRPQIPEGQAGWGKKGLLDLQQIKELHKS